MRKISIAMMALLCATAVVGVAAAGDPKTDPKATKTAPPPAKKKVPDSAVAKPADPAPEAAQAPPTPAPSPELLAAGKAMKGTWRCKGEEFGPDGAALKATATIKNTVDLDKMWIKGVLKMPKKKGQKRGVTWTSYRTYSPTEKKWISIGVDNMGGWSKGWSTGPDAAGKTTWEMESNMGGQVFKGRDYEEPGAKKNQRHFWGEYSMDGGKTYNKAYDVTCTK